MVVDPAEIEELFALEDHIIPIDKFHRGSEHLFTGLKRLTWGIRVG